MSVLKYFAYGSNMHPYRLQRRVPSAQPVQAAILDDYDLRFHKEGKDGSAKCDIVESDGSKVYGVLYHMDAAEKPLLDRAEGLGHGYEEADLTVQVAGESVPAYAYAATPDYIDDELQPFVWYKDFVVHGADHHTLPNAYVETLRAVGAIPDPNDDRVELNRSILNEVVEPTPAVV